MGIGKIFSNFVQAFSTDSNELTKEEQAELRRIRDINKRSIQERSIQERYGEAKEGNPIFDTAQKMNKIEEKRKKGAIKKEEEREER